MLTVNPPTVGPIVGQADTQHLRIMARAKDHQDHQDLLSIVCMLCEGATLDPETAQYRVTKANQVFDMTGVVIFSGLKPDCLYSYKIGFVEVATDALNVNELDWDEVSHHQITTLSNDPSKAIAICAGSCRYIAETSIGEKNTWSRKWFCVEGGDRTYQSIVDKHPDISHMVMCGDQVYMDDLNVFGSTESLFEAREKYKAAFGPEHSPNMAKLLASKPCFMILDDHEIEDNWPAKASGQDMRKKYVNTLHAYQTYQASHSPLMTVKDEALVSNPSKWYYNYSDGCCDFFVLDTRTERKIDLKKTFEERCNSTEIWKHRIISTKQMADLKAWLTDGSGRVKCMVSSVPFFPDFENGADQWSEFRYQRDQIIDFCIEKQLTKVFSITGDIHMSYTSVLTQPGSDFKMLQVISSPLFWPYGHGNEDDYPNLGLVSAGQPAGELPGRDEFEIHTPTKAIHTDNFSRLDIQPDGIRVRVFDRKGELLDDNRFTF